MLKPAKSPRPSHDRKPSDGSFHNSGDSSSRRFFGVLPSRTSEEKVVNKRRKVEYNPLGLTMLYSPPEPQVDFVFVHGLRGGSVKTWCENEDLNLFWPKEWIAVDDDLRHRVRTSSFGYASNYLTASSSQLTLHDFGRDLIHQLDNSPYLRKEPHTPIVLIGHSMGGLVIKKACLLAHQQGKKVASRIKCILFLATPHRGSAAAENLGSVLDLVGWEKGYVEDLRRNSSSLQVINDEFSRLARSEKLRLCSLYETQPMIGSTVLVKQDSAVLGYDAEEVNMVLADHRSICKFKSPADEQYLGLRNTLLRLADDLTTALHLEDSQEKMEQMMSVEAYLNVLHHPQSDLDQHCDRQIEQTCVWLNHRPAFQGWVDGDAQPADLTPSSPRAGRLQRRPTIPLKLCSVYWLTGNPGAGKSTCAAHVTTHLQSQKNDCTYHFFRTGENAKTSVSAMLLSIAWQMAILHPSVRTALVELHKARVTFDGDDDGVIWRKLFINCILKLAIRQPQFWVIDAIDECQDVEKLLSKLSTLESAFALRIFMTSRHSSRLESFFKSLETRMHIIVDVIQPGDTRADMALYLRCRLHSLPADGPLEQAAMVENLLLKANSSFLWLRAVCDELEAVYSQDSIDEVLAEVPCEMSELYERAVQSLLELKRQGSREVAKILLIWSASAIRPLTLEELNIALNEYDGPDVMKLNTKSKGYQVKNLKVFIDGPCRGLLFTDGRGCVQFVHATAREYVHKALASTFKKERTACHEKLARACLRCLMKELAPSRTHSHRNNGFGRVSNRTVFAKYASVAWSEHLAASSSESHQILEDVAAFLSGKGLAWIEHVAGEQPSLYHLTRAGKNFNEFLKRRVDYQAPIGHDFSTLAGWATDLIRLVAKFGRNLRSSPSSIHNLIPLVAPRQSRLFQAAQDGPKWMTLVGAGSETWDDCVCAIRYEDSWGTCLATGNNVFAIGLKSGIITVYDQSTCQERLSVQHQLPPETFASLSSPPSHPPSTVRLLAFDSSDAHFASASVHSICIWSIDGTLLQATALQEPCVSIRFSLDQEELLGVTRSSRINRWSLSEDEIGMLSTSAVHTRRLSAEDTRLGLSSLPRQAPLAAAVSPDQSTLAMLYRGRPIYICSLIDDTVLGLCGRDVGSKVSNISVQTALFNPNPELSLLAVAYQDGELAIYDIWEEKELVSVDGDAYSLAATPDGRTLGTGNTRGTINLWDFETLCLLYSIRSGCDEVRSLAFSGDGLRVVDIRDSNSKVWEPSALVRRSAEENTSMSDAVALDAPVVGVNEETRSATALCPHDIGDLIYAGFDDGSVVAYSVPTGLVHSRMYSHGRSLFISTISCRKGLLGSADAGGRVIIRRLPGKTEHGEIGVQLPRVDMAAPVQQLIFNDEGTQLLIATAKTASIWNVDTGQKCAEISDSHVPQGLSRPWVRFGHKFGAVNRSWLETYQWDDLVGASLLPIETLNAIQEPPMSASKQEVLIQNYDGNIVASAFALAKFPGRLLVGWMARATDNAAEESVNPRAFFLNLQSKHIYAFIGICAGLAVFLDNELWVCSARLSGVDQHKTPEVRRHFFVPLDFLRGSTACRPIVTAQGDIVFVKGGELAIVRGGLSWAFD